MTSDKIRPHHLARKAILYVRQSSTHQVLHNRESSALQYAMRDRLTALGWWQIDTVDDDLGRSAAGGMARAGFERMVAEVCLGKVGAVAGLAILPMLLGAMMHSPGMYSHGGSESPLQVLAVQGIVAPFGVLLAALTLLVSAFTRRGVTALTVVYGIVVLAIIVYPMVAAALAGLTASSISVLCQQQARSAVKGFKRGGSK